MKYTFNNTDEAIGIIIESSQKNAKAIETGDYKTANKNYHLINNAIIYLLERDDLEKLRKLLEIDDASVKVWVASYLIKEGDKHALEVLEEIASQSIPHHSFDAKMVLQEWRKGKLK